MAHTESVKSDTSSTLESARYDYRNLTVSGVSSIVVKAREFADEDGDLGDEAVKRLFDHIWIDVKKERRLDLVIDLCNVRVVAQRFKRELAFLSRKLRHQARLVRLTHE